MHADAHAGTGDELPPELEEIEEGPGEGAAPAAGARTRSRAVDLDLINNIMREPYRERFSIILNELGVGLAGRGEDLDAVIRRANPALKEVDDVLKILARQNEQLEQLAVDSDTIMAPARPRARPRGLLDREHERGRGGDGRAARRPRGDIARLPEFLARAARRRWCGWARPPTR